MYTTYKVYVWYYCSRDRYLVVILKSQNQDGSDFVFMSEI